MTIAKFHAAFMLCFSYTWTKTQWKFQNTDCSTVSGISRADSSL